MSVVVVRGDFELLRFRQREMNEVLCYGRGIFEFRGNMIFVRSISGAKMQFEEHGRGRTVWLGNLRLVGPLQGFRGDAGESYQYSWTKDLFSPISSYGGRPEPLLL
jgi:hypothetical protein